MATARLTESSTQAVNGIGAALAGIGILTLALAPLSIPFLILTAAFLAPVAILALVAALVLGLFAGAVVAVRTMWRRLGKQGAQSGRRGPKAQPAR